MIPRYFIVRNSLSVPKYRFEMKRYIYKTTNILKFDICMMDIIMVIFLLVPLMVYFCNKINYFLLLVIIFMNFYKIKTILDILSNILKIYIQNIF